MDNGSLDSLSFDTYVYYRNIDDGQLKRRRPSYSWNCGRFKLDRKRGSLVQSYKGVPEKQNPRSTGMTPIIKATAYLRVANLQRTQSSVEVTT